MCESKPVHKKHSPVDQMLLYKQSFGLLTRAFFFTTKQIP